MSELFGPLPRHAVAGLPLVCAVASPLVAAGVVAVLGPWLEERSSLRGLAARAGTRTASDLVAALGAVGSVLVVAVGLLQAVRSPSGMIVSPAWVLARVGSIDAALGFDADVGRGALALVFALGSVLIALRAGSSDAPGAPSRAGWRSLALAAALGALLADGLATALLALGCALVATGAASLRGRWLPGGAAIAALTLAGATLGWGLDGRWLDGLAGNFLSDYAPRFVAVRDGAPTAARLRGPAAADGKGTLTMTSAPGTEVHIGVQDDASLRGRAGPLATSPFVKVALPATLQKIALVPGGAAIVGGDGLEIALADNVDIRPGDDIVLAPLGGTWTWRDIDGQLLLRDANDKHPLRSDLAAKRIASMALPTAVVLLAFLAAALAWLDGPRRIARALATSGPLDAALVAATLAVAAVAPASRLSMLVPLSGAAVLLAVAALLVAFGVLTASSRGRWLSGGSAAVLVGAALLAVAADATPVLALGIALAAAVSARFAEVTVRRAPHAWIAGPAEEDMFRAPLAFVGTPPAPPAAAPAAAKPKSKTKKAAKADEARS